MCMCGSIWCFSCKQEGHWPLSCEQYKWYIDNFKEEYELDGQSHSFLSLAELSNSNLKMKHYRFAGSCNTLSPALVVVLPRKR